MAEFTVKKVTKVDRGVVDGIDDAIFSVKDIENGSFAIASNKRELKALMRSDADVVYNEKKGKLYLNDNGTVKGWGKKKVGGLLATFKGKPQLSADNFDGLSAHTLALQSIGGGGGKQVDDIKDQIALAREGLSDAEESRLYGETLINPKKGLKSINKAAKKEGYVFDKDELADALNEMDKFGTFTDIKLDDAALEALFGMGGEQEQHYRGMC